jgi:rhodanese-related sulfurtransferase
MRAILASLSALLGGGSDAVRTIGVAPLKADLERGAVPLLLDVREPAEFARGHVAGARNLPLPEVAARVAELGPPEGEIYVICEFGGRSARAGATLAAAGYRAVNVAGGTAAWRGSGYRLEG